MKTLKKILWIVLAIIVLVLIIGFLLPRHMHIERSMVIKAHPAMIYEQVNTVGNWTAWSPWHKKDSAMKITYSGPPSGKGASYSWVSDNKQLGTGSLTVENSAPYDSVICAMKFMEERVAYSNFYFLPEEGGTNVKWTLEADLGMNPFMRYMGLFMDANAGREYEAGLKNLQALLEANPNAMLKIDTGSVPETPYIAIRQTITMAEIGPKMSEFYGELYGFMQGKGMQPANPPFCIYHTWEKDQFDMETAFPLVAPVKPEGRIIAGTLKASKVVSIDFYGPYEATYIPHMALEKYISDNKLKRNGSPWEVYVTDPMAEKDPNKLLTKVVWPVE